MKNNSILFSLPCVMLSVVLDSAQADENCPLVLQPSLVRFDQDTETSISRFESMDKDKADANSTGIVAAYDSYKFNYSQAQSANERLKTILDYKFNNKQKTSMLSSIVPKEAFAAYEACLRAKSDISYRVTDAFSKKFFITVYWHPLYEAPKPSNGSISVLFGNFIESADAKAGEISKEFTVEDKKSKTFAIDRDVFEPTQIHVDIDGRPDDIELPAISKKITSLGYVRGENKSVGGRETSGVATITLCAEIPKEEIGTAAMVPGSFELEYETKRFINAVIEKEGPVTENASGACSPLTVRWNEVWSSLIDVTVHGKIAVFRAVDRPK